MQLSQLSADDFAELDRVLEAVEQSAKASQFCEPHPEQAPQPPPPPPQQQPQQMHWSTSDLAREDGEGEMKGRSLLGEVLQGSHDASAADNYMKCAAQAAQPLLTAASLEALPMSMPIPIPIQSAAHVPPPSLRLPPQPLLPSAVITIAQPPMRPPPLGVALTAASTSERKENPSLRPHVPPRVPTTATIPDDLLALGARAAGGGDGGGATTERSNGSGCGGCGDDRKYGDGKTDGGNGGGNNEQSGGLPQQRRSCNAGGGSGGGILLENPTCRVGIPREAAAAASIDKGTSEWAVLGADGGGGDPNVNLAGSVGGLPSIAEVRASKAAAAAGGVQRPGAQPPVLEFEGSIRYATTAVEVDWLCGQLEAVRPAVIGLDMEWRPQYIAGVCRGGDAPLGASTAGGSGSGDDTGGDTAAAAAAAADSNRGRHCCCLLLHIRYSGVTPRLRALLEAELPCKVGVNITGDANKLKRDYGVEMRGLLELDGLANERVLQHVEHVTTNTEYRSRWSLAALVATVLKRHLPKPNSLRCGNWERRPLDAAQKRYGALDAYAGLAVWAALSRLPYRKAPAPLTVPPAAAAMAAKGEAAVIGGGSSSSSAAAAAATTAIAPAAVFEDVVHADACAR
ncbi:hypothetical protein VOLCADRAFT_90238 [Volvox carteri f. nagariensis]|uniref:3'-5' exonuclease n=1 Tax=Volvox carteri f. nagariensis TaxID=3068 RepID=D8TTU4_VOLCA|nr:uncharacterized protein VOLCADRAFT_90238 [Volvox carteri f. nagariensis]EFJ48923.1 hypothetical protein VOLCADRAFT_90238 [Volvox carteri f. nagariensis]|eukprot:XP_002949820.1 hypothetical protein VOLCADRAFT_90238 [Volvox carteri f. nagariensis]